MNAFTITLKDGTEYALADGAFGNKFTIICADKQMFNAVWDKMTPANLDHVTVSANGTPITVLTNIVFDGTQAVIGNNGIITGHFYFHGADYTPAEQDYIEAAKILLGEE